MKVFTCTDHDQFWPVGVASVVVAETELKARNALKRALKERGLDPEKTFTLQELDLTQTNATILRDGEY